jgi:peptidyl-dipeptidase A
MQLRILLIGLMIAASADVSWSQEKTTETAVRDGKEFIKSYNDLYQIMYTVDSEANWKASTDVTEEHTGGRIGADQVFSAYQGSPYILNESKEFLKQKNLFDPLSIRQMEKILYMGAHSPGTIPEVVNARVVAEARQSALLDGFTFCLEKKEDQCLKPVTPNQIEEVLSTSTDLVQRIKYWEVSKESGVALKPGLVELRKLRNEIARASGYDSYFAMEVSDYGMTVKKMMELMQKLLSDIRPLYEQLHCWTKYKLAERYHQPPPKMIPADWLGNRWSQSWPGIVEGVDMNPYFKNQTPEWIIHQAERFYVSLGMPALPESFWKKSDLYELPADSKRKKNTHASAWNIDLKQDVRSLMSVRPDFQWFLTTHHELGHIYYYLAYSNPEVPYVLREGANRAFHEGIGDLIGMAAAQPAYLKEIGVLPKDVEIDQTQWLLNQALLDTVIFLPWSAGVMTGWEHDFYEENLPADQMNQRWWEYAAKYQGVAPPEPRGEEYCDACTKTHINDDPAAYYDYALARVIRYQLHDYIARNILKQDPHDCNYYGNKEVGKFLWDILKLGGTRDWRQLIKEKTGEELSTRAMVEYFKPLTAYLEKENKGRKISWD